MPETPLDRLIAQRKQFLGFVQRRVQDSELAEDILQTAYLRAFEHQDDFEPDEPAMAWFYRLLRNAMIDNYRRQESKNKALEVWTRELETAVQPSLHTQNEVCSCLHVIVDGLKPEYSETLRAIDLGDQRVQEFAQQHNLSASNAEVRVHRARAERRNNGVVSLAYPSRQAPGADLSTVPVSMSLHRERVLFASAVQAPVLCTRGTHSRFKRL